MTYIRSSMSSLAETTAEEGARRVALSYLDQAAKASKHIHDDEAVEALHDFRVGMRRLRSCLRAYDAILGKSVGDKTRKRLKKVASATNPGRDAEVQLDWMVQLSQTAAPEERHGVDWLAGRLRDDKDAAYAHVRARLCDEFDKIEDKLRGALSTYTVRHVVGEPSSGPRFGELAAEVLEQQLEALRDDLARVHGIEDEAVAHRARIHGKRLRYLLEPFRGQVEGAKTLVKHLKALQDLLGDLNDLHNLAVTVGNALEESSVERARRLREAATTAGGDVIAELETDNEPGLLAMLKRIQKDRFDMFGRLMDEWLAEGGRLDTVEAELEELTERLRGAAPVEIERKYLLLGLPEVCNGAAPLRLEQGYLPGKRLIERVRKSVNGASTTYRRTVKLGAGIERIEVEEDCSPEVFDALYALTEGKRVVKKRYCVTEGDLVWEIDAFTDRDLFLAEVELPSVDAEVRLPDWLAPLVVREVTDEDAFVNANLAK